MNSAGAIKCTFVPAWKMTTMSDPVSVAPPERSLVQRAIGMIFSPGATFRSVVSDPRPAPILFVVCLVIGLTQTLPQMTDRGRQAALDMQVQQRERFTGQPVTPEVYAQMERTSTYTRYLGIVAVFIFLPIVSLILTAVFWGFFNTILGGTASFKQVLGIVTHTSVIGALGAVVSAPIQYLQGVMTTSGPFNLGALVPMLEPGFVYNVLSGISVFTLWQIVVTAIGLGVLYKRKTTGIAVSLLVFYVGVASALTAAFSGGR
jgi:hypothetical protein